MSGPSPLQAATAAIVGVFHEYSGKQGNKNTLTKAELKDLLQNQFGDVLGNVKDKAALDEIFTLMDQNRDNTVDFMEYFTMVGTIAMMCNEFFQKGAKRNIK